ncbi:Oidioi.mRNA.OKI2018_I69.chr2.g8132.t1.cds [Oikopleura dioica]|uniref:Oidioi.mRNA.OKI2018_I69.chr2.g8132.t1.cds n=1 Tax=Oikopleura dioica TaxID=34765 RepID=A0ABN7TEM4_OIKDI|nr:Oidioi.mRNA.OKI2018_I69.chr2.g8132.t1.cds [Oikopleura dioica]
MSRRFLLALHNRPFAREKETSEWAALSAKDQRVLYAAEFGYTNYATYFVHLKHKHAAAVALQAPHLLDKPKIIWSKLLERSPWGSYSRKRLIYFVLSTGFWIGFFILLAKFSQYDWPPYNLLPVLLPTTMRPIDSQIFKYSYDPSLSKMTPVEVATKYWLTKELANFGTHLSWDCSYHGYRRPWMNIQFS